MGEATHVAPMIQYHPSWYEDATVSPSTKNSALKWQSSGEVWTQGPRMSCTTHRSNEEETQLQEIMRPDAARRDMETERPEALIVSA